MKVSYFIRCQKGVIWCQEGVIKYQEFVMWCQEDVIWCQEDVRYCQEGVRLCQEDVRWCQQCLRKLTDGVRKVSDTHCALFEGDFIATVVPGFPLDFFTVCPSVLEWVICGLLLYRVLNVCSKQ